MIGKRNNIPEVMAVFLPGLLVVVVSLPIMLASHGMPIDDAYIFERYASNLAGGAGFSFNPGEVSFGCTSLIWPVIVAGFIKLLPGADYALLVQFIGVAMSAIAAGLASKIVIRLTSDIAAGFAVGIILALSPHTYMNAVSGMESALFTCAALAVVFAQIKGLMSRNPFAMGMMAAMLPLLRPEGVVVALAIILERAALMLRDRSKAEWKKTALTLGQFAVGYMIIITPALVFVRANSSSFVPGTYMGKILSSDPNILYRPFLTKLLVGLKYFVDGWHQLLSPMHYLGIVVFLLGLTGAGALIKNLLGSPKTDQGNNSGVISARLTMYAFIFMPFAYGFSFPAGPQFGGYYQRYIMVSLFAMVAMGAVAYTVLLKKFGVRSKAWVAIPLVIAMAYQTFLYSRSIGGHMGAYIEQVEINEGLRTDAAEWIRLNTPPDSKVFLGYTGLGVIGQKCGRYVLDMGALINPDIFPYLEGTKPLSEERWMKMLEYIKARDLDYFVTFTDPMWGHDMTHDPHLEHAAAFRRQIPETGKRLREISIYKVVK